MAGTISVDLDSAGEQGHSGEYGPYPFNPHTAFQSLAPKVEEIQDKEGSGKKGRIFAKLKNLTQSCSVSDRSWVSTISGPF